MRVVGELRGLCATQFPRPIDDVFHTQEEQQRCGFDQHHPEVRQARQGIDPHLWDQDATVDLALGHAVGGSGFKLCFWDGAHGPKEHVGGKSPKDDSEGQDSQHKAIGFVLPLRGVAQGQFRLGTDDEVVALVDRLFPVGTFPTVADVFENLIERDDEEQEERDVRHAAHDGDIGFSNPPQGSDAASGGGRATKAESQSGRGRD